MYELAQDRCVTVAGGGGTAADGGATTADGGERVDAVAETAAGGGGTPPEGRDCAPCG
jgi:hypothetical protein